jgi:hypothetical protein
MMIKNIAYTSILVSCLTLVACRQEDAHGVLVGRFSDQDTLPLRATISLPFSEVQSELRYRLHEGSLSCELTATLPTSDLLLNNDCAGLHGEGEISCNDGRKQPLSWMLTSCHSGFGRTASHNSPTFTFGFGPNPDRALDQLEEAEKAE